MISLLSSHKVSLEAGNRGVRVKSNFSIPDNILIQIETAIGDDFRVLIDKDLLPKRFQDTSRNSLSIFELDYGIASLVFSLNKVGLYTSMSCDGHGRLEAKMWFNGNQIEEIRELLVMANREISFAYNWDVKKEAVGFVLIGRRRLTSDQLDVGKVQDDAFAFSEYLINTYSSSIT